MKFKHNIFFTILFLFILPAITQAQGLSCDKIYRIQNQFFLNHVLYSNTSKGLQQKTVKQMIENLDPEKIYFLNSDVNAIKRRSQKIFSNLNSGNCKDLYYIYDLYVKRFNNRISFAEKYLNSSNFKLNRKTRYIIDDKVKKHPSSEKQANRLMKSYLQFQIANIFVTEKDLKKSIKQFSYILKSRKKQIKSWKPKLTRKEIRTCIAKSKNSFQSCKPYKWYAFYLNSFAESLDMHSSYLDNEAVKSFQISMNLALEGIGATLRSSFGYTVVERLVPGGAAFKSKKIKKKDKILAVGQSKNKMVNIFGESLDDIVSIIRGNKGTPVYLKILRETKNKKGKSTKKEFIVKLIRDKVDLEEDASSIVFIDKKIKNKTQKVAVIRVPSFYGSGSYGKSVTRDVRKLIYKAKRKGAKALVLDLSGNRGGSLDESVSLAGLFFSKGNVVKQSEKNKDIFSKIFRQKVISFSKPKNTMVYSVIRDEDPSIDYKGPLVVLVNRYSASASEIVSGTLQDYKRAVVVGGDHTFGKGSVQSVVSAGFGLGAIKTTVGLYFIPSGKSTQRFGIFSDIPLPHPLNLSKLGEKSLDNSLPAKTIANFKSSSAEIFSAKKSWTPISSRIIRKLKSLSRKRVVKNKEFHKIKNRIKKHEAKLNSKSITIAEILDEKEEMDLDLEEDLDQENALDPKVRLKKYLKRADVQEAANIAADLARLQPKSS